MGYREFASKIRIINKDITCNILLQKIHNMFFLSHDYSKCISQCERKRGAMSVLNSGKKNRKLSY